MKQDAPTPVHAWLVMIKAMQAITRYALAGLEKSGLGDSDFRVLEVLLHKGPLPVNVIGVSSGNGNLRTLVPSKNHPTKMKRSRTRLQLVLWEDWYWGPAALCWRFSVPHEMRSDSVPRGDG